MKNQRHARASRRLKREPAGPAHEIDVLSVMSVGEQPARGLHATRSQPISAPGPATLGRLANTLTEQHQLEDETRLYQAAITNKPDNPDTYIALGLLLEEQGKPQEAFQTYQALLCRHPKDVRAYNNLAGVLIGLGHLDLAIASSRVAVSLAPDHPGVYLNLAFALRLRGDDEEALATYKKIVAIEPDHGEALVELCHRRQHACDWEGLTEQQALSWAQSYRKGRLVSPFSIMTSGASSIEQLRCARVWGERLKGLPHTPLAPYVPRPVTERQKRLKIGYLSSDFHNHATAMLIVDMLEQHDRSRFTIVAYSLGQDDGNAMRRRIVAAVDRFVDLTGVSDRDAARLIREDGIDILLDLKGYTQDARVKILAYEPAPIQVNYLGFPGTMGVPFIDYIIADGHVVPPDHHSFYDEKVVCLPHCYQPNDRSRALSSMQASRTDFGLPNDAFVFCCFNSPYKITPAIFDIWMRLLKGTPGSVLWLLEANRQAAANLRREAALRGIAVDRLIFAPFVDAESHLARFNQADLFLDTLPVNAHTTASEALWAGLPVLTCTGDTFAGRVAGSLLHAIGLPDLVAPSLQAYEIDALSLAHDPDRLAALRERLHDNRFKAPLFDTPRYVKTFEKALSQMAERLDLEQPAESFAVLEF